MVGIRTTISARGRRTTVTMARIGRELKSYRRSETALLKEVNHLKELVTSLTTRLAELEQEVETTKAAQPDDIIVIREISKEQARKEIIKSFEAGQPLDQADLADMLSLEISLVIEVCNELIEEGVVVFYDDDRS